MKLTQFDVKCALLHAPIEKNVIIRTPEGSSRKYPYLKLKKSLYGLKQSPKNRYKTLKSWIKLQGYHESTSDPCLYLNTKISKILYFHIDNLIHLGNSNLFETNFLHRFKNSLCHPPNTILGMLMEIKNNRILLSQPNHIARGLEELSLTSCKDTHIPLTQNLNLKPASNVDHAKFFQLNIHYRLAIGLLNHLAHYSQPNIPFSVSSLAWFNAKPGMTHWREVKKGWKYLKTTKDLKIIIKYNLEQEVLSGFSDATLGDDLTPSKSQTSYLILHYCCPDLELHSTEEYHLFFHQIQAKCPT